MVVGCPLCLVFGFGFVWAERVGKEEERNKVKENHADGLPAFSVSICWSMSYCLHRRAARLVGVEEMGLKGAKRRRLSLPISYIFSQVLKDNPLVQLP